MQPAAVVLASVALSAGVAVSVPLVLRGNPPAVIAGASFEEVAALERQLDALREALRASAEASAAPGVQRVPVAAPDLEAAVQRYLEQHGTKLAAASGKALDLEAVFAELRGTDPWENGAAWRRVFEAGRFPDLIARFEQRARERQTDPDAHVELAMAYLAQADYEPEKWQLGIDADKCFDKALELDPKHWDARFTKAVCYTFWPDFLGKKKEAVGHFETLVSQQEQGPAQPEFAQTYLYLGNMYEQRGDAAKAQEIWARGGRLFPDDAELQSKLRAR